MLASFVFKLCCFCFGLGWVCVTVDGVEMTCCDGCVVRP